MERIYIKDTPLKIGQKVCVKGYVLGKRDHGKVVFVDLKDITGLLQCVGVSKLSEVGPQDVLSIEGLVKTRPDKLINPKLLTGEIELEVEKYEILAKSQELPFDMGKEDLEVSLPTLLDYRTLTLRNLKIANIFKVQEAVMQGFRKASQDLGCTEIFTPTISASSTEGGAEVFKVKYYDYEAFLIQSPQLYKQMLVPVFERVSVVSHAYRAEPSVTTRHLSESIQLDCELGFVTFEELLDALEYVGAETIKYVQEKYPEVLEQYGVAKIKFGEKIPRLTMREAQELILKRTGVDHTKELDLMPEDEREICKWARDEKDCDLVTITHYPTKKRAFYTKPDPKNPEFSLSYDLLFRGIEILSGSQRINEYEELVTVIKDRGMNPQNFQMYLQAFKYGMPEEGGFSFGLERLTMQILGLANVRQASLFPRDMERVDVNLSKYGILFNNVKKNQKKAKLSKKKLS